MTSSLPEVDNFDAPHTSRIENPCEFCFKTKFKYKCPGCGVKTCSLECCRGHKQSTGCTGQRDKTKFISKDEFNEHSLMNDYRFLEEQSRIIDAYQRASELGEEHILNGKTLSSNLDNDPTKNIQFYGTYENLRKFVYKQSNICLKLMPPQSSRHTNNKTRFNRVKNMVSWSIEFIFHLPGQEDKNQKYFRYDSRKLLFSSKETLKSCLKYFYEKTQNELFDKSNFKYEKNEDKIKKLDLLNENFKNIFQNYDFQNLNVLFEIQDYKEKKRYYIKFDLENCLDECLKNQTIIEYPSLYLVLNKNLADYEIIENSVEINKNNREILKEDVNDIKRDKKNESKEEGEEDGEIAESESEEDDENEEEILAKKMRIEPKTSQNYQNNDRYRQNDGEESSELEEGEERD